MLLSKRLLIEAAAKIQTSSFSKQLPDFEESVEDYSGRYGTESLQGVVRDGIEPPTHGFSVHCSTN